MFYYEYLIYGFVAQFAAGIGWITWKLINHPWNKIKLAKDPRWKNKDQIANFIAITFTIDVVAVAMVISTVN